ncbi:MAG: metallophosphoesterase [Polyangiaceae bacterium]
MLCLTAGAFAFACGGDDTFTPAPIASSDGGGDAVADTALSDATLPIDSALDARAISARNWAEFPAIAQVDGVSEIWALSDIHGDYAALTKLLAGANVITKVPDGPSTVIWSQGAAVLVIVGDLIDKGPDAPDVVRLMMALQISAAAAGGKVIVTMGNHEAEFFANPYNDKASGEAGVDPELGAIGLTPDATAAGVDDIGLFLRDLPIAARVDDWFFVHAGKTDGLTASGLSTEIQNEIDDAGFGASVLSADASMLEARLNDSPPQWWDVTGDAGGLLTQWTNALGAKHLVMGHQPGAVGIAGGPNRNSDDMFAAYGGLVFLIDTGMSVGVDDTGGALLHVKNAGMMTVTFEEVLPNGNKKSL